MFCEKSQVNNNLSPSVTMEGPLLGCTGLVQSANLEERVTDPSLLFFLTELGSFFFYTCTFLLRFLRFSLKLWNVSENSEDSGDKMQANH